MQDKSDQHALSCEKKNKKKTANSVCLLVLFYVCLGNICDNPGPLSVLQHTQEEYSIGCKCGEGGGKKKKEFFKMVGWKEGVKRQVKGEGGNKWWGGRGKMKEYGRKARSKEY